jgi:hypothetical protein
MQEEETISTLKESSIDWLINEMKKRNFFYGAIHCNKCNKIHSSTYMPKFFAEWHKLVLEAKEMEKKYIKESYSFGLKEGIDKGKNNEDPEFYSDEDYYNNNFNFNP